MTIARPWSHTPIRNHNRIAFFTVILAGGLIFYHWEAMLISYLAVRTTVLPFRSIEELYTKTNYKVYYALSPFKWFPQLFGPSPSYAGDGVKESLLLLLLLLHTTVNILISWVPIVMKLCMNIPTNMPDFFCMGPSGSGSGFDWKFRFCQVGQENFLLLDQFSPGHRETLHGHSCQNTHHFPFLEMVVSGSGSKLDRKFRFCPVFHQSILASYLDNQLNWKC